MKRVLDWYFARKTTSEKRCNIKYKLPKQQIDIEEYYCVKLSNGKQPHWIRNKDFPQLQGKIQTKSNPNLCNHKKTRHSLLYFGIISSKNTCIKDFLHVSPFPKE